MTDGQIFSLVFLGSTGKGGDAIINATESIFLSGTTSIADLTQKDTQGRSGIFVNVQPALFDPVTREVILDPETGEPIPSTGDAGTLTLTTQDLTVENGANITAITTSVGNAGNLNINVDKLIVRGLGDISAGSVLGEFAVETGRGNGGVLNITATESVEVTGSDIINGQTVKSSIDAFTESNGNAGNLNITTDKLTVSDGAEIDTSTTGQGRGGNLVINAENLTVRDRAEIDTSTSGQGDAGNAGNLVINAENLTVSDRAEIDTSTEGPGDAGNLTIFTGDLAVSDEAKIDTSTEGSGSAGNIYIAADDLNLDTGKITASTNAGDKGNITLVIDNDISLRDDSLISAEATGDADGGNININTQYIFARPNTNNDIVTKAIGGDGGDINITANRLFAIEERSSTPPNRTNDIDASSKFGLDGTVIIDTSDTQLFRQALELQGTVAVNVLGIDACSRAQAKEESTFIVTGRGGIPRQPTDPLMADALIPDGKPITIDKEAALNSIFVEKPETKQENPNYIPAEIKPIKTSRGDIYPARGFIKTEDGRVILTTYPTDNINTRTPDNSDNCTPL